MYLSLLFPTAVAMAAPNANKMWIFSTMILFLFIEVSLKDFTPIASSDIFFNSTLNSAAPLQSALVAMILLVNTLALYSYPLMMISKGEGSLKSMYLVNNAISVLVIYSKTPIVFYMLFEMSAIPIFIMVMGWGYQPEKIKAGYSMLMYTVVMAFPVMVAIAMEKSASQEWYFSYSSTCAGLGGVSGAFAAMLMLAFLVKLPLYSLHLWLPMAHVEAPVFGSMVLAGILLKFGGVGVLFMQSLVNSCSAETFFSVVSVSGLLAVSIIMVQVTDIKMIIAYTSVAHMGFIPLTLYTMQPVAISSGALMMLTHAFSSSGMFFVAFIIYKASNSRSILINKGLISFSPFLSMMWLMVILASMGTPPTINLISEILCISVAMKHYTLLAPIMGSAFVLTSAVHLLMFSSISQGGASPGSMLSSQAPPADSAVAFYHVMMTLWAFPLLDLMF